ncbi:DUF3556 domain-containing protein [Nocardioides albidus]|uniref:DUF3556 domain-containing protein n=1 Tax=Nocardioides albidus TaxID=1517589 RepID=A0A5C4WMF5_9ACTN|nr:DUF3556 domain-containing protein [Nocardioides albidus]TNM49510.1 DUF3556 domain-containing protein [Nocardioides albidus]
MPFKDPVFPPVDPATFMQLPLPERTRVLTTFWAENGFGSAYKLHLVYIMKFVFMSTIGGLLIVTLTSPDIGSILDVSTWWNEPIVYQKLILWVALLEVIGVGGAWGPLTGHFKPFYGGARYFMRPGLLRMAPWPDKVPFTGGVNRTPADAALYLAYIVSLAIALILPGVQYGAADGQPILDAAGGVVRHEALFAPIVLFIVLGLRDKVVFLCGRGEQYLPAMLFFAFLEPHDMLIAGKLLIVVVWCGAAFSKLGKHFENVVPPMVSNTPWTSKKMRLAHYRDFPNDLRPSKPAWFMAHVMGTLAEMGVPLVLLFTTNWTITLLGVGAMVLFHIFITSTFPLAVPLEWNILFGYIAIALFAGFPNGDGYSLFDFSEPWMLPVIAAGLLFFPVLGNLRPDLVSFLPSMRQYAGNWASAVWTLKPSAEEKLKKAGMPVGTHVEQLEALGVPVPAGRIVMELFVAWRSMHSQGRGLFSVLRNYLGDELDQRMVWEGETGANLLLGWNFGDGHIHGIRFLEALRERCDFEPGEFVTAWVESQPVHKDSQEWFIFDGALGVVQRGTWKVADCVVEQPWLPNGPIPLNVTWAVAK